VELALGLYRDHILVRAVLELAQLPDSVQRVALSLDHPTLGPFIVVARDGGFVTCLGRGMSVGGRHVITRDKLDTMSLRLSDLRERIEYSKRVAKTKGEIQRLINRIHSAGDALCREDFIAISAWAPLLGSKFLDAALEAAKELELERSLYFRAGKRPSEADLRDSYRKVCCIGHLLVLAVMGDYEALAMIDWGKYEQTVSQPAAEQGLTTLMLRAAWAAARLGPPALPAHEGEYTREVIPDRLLDGLVGMSAIAHRYPETKARVVAFLTNAERQGRPADPDAALSVSAMKGGFAEHARNALTGETDASAIIRTGRDLCVTLSELAPEGSSYRFDSPEDVPEPLALTAVYNMPLDILEGTGFHICLLGASFAARAAPEDFYFPREYARYYCYEHSPDRLLELLKAAGNYRFRRAKPAASKKTAGRNELCPCGSGKKYKRCHGVTP
jgi:hypothetical protein